MRSATLFASDDLVVYGIRCTAGPEDRTYPEVHERHSVSYVSFGSFGYRARGRTFDLVAGSVLVGAPGEEYVCTHEHARGDVCLSFQFSPAIAATLGAEAPWRVGGLPPLADLVVLGELARAAAGGRSDVSLDEIGVALAARSAAVATGTRRSSPSPSDRKRAIEAALRIDEDPSAAADLASLAREAGLSPFHFLRVFTGVLGATPHQFLLRARLRKASALLADAERPVTDVALESGFADLSNFVRTFRRAAGVSPRDYRKASRGDRKILQERIARRP